MLRLKYTYSNENSEFISEIIKSVDESNNNYGWVITDLDIIANDREDYLYNKPMFSERVFNLQNQVESNYGVYIKTDELLGILFESRTVYRGDFSYIKVFSGIEEFKLSRENDTHNSGEATNIMLKIHILDGDIISIVSGNNTILNFIKEQYAKYIM